MSLLYTPRESPPEAAPPAPPAIPGLSSDDEESLDGVPLETGRETYVRTCEALKITPCGRWLRALTGGLHDCSIPHYGLGPRGAVAVGASLHINECLLDVNLADNRLGAEGVGIIASALLGNETLTSLDLAKNGIGPDNCEALARGITGSSSLHTLSLAANGLGDTGVCALLAPLWEGGALRVRNLSLADNGVTQLGAQEIVRALHDGACKLQSLDIRWNQLGPLGAAALAHALLPADAGNYERGSDGGDGRDGSHWPGLTALDMSWNQIADDGAQALAAVLPRSRALLSLSLEHNGVGLQGARALAAALSTLGSVHDEMGGGELACAPPPALEQLSLSANPIGREGLRALIEGLEACAPPCPLRRVLVEDCALLPSEPLLQKLEAALRGEGRSEGAARPAWLAEQLRLLRPKPPAAAQARPAAAASGRAQPRGKASSKLPNAKQPSAAAPTVAPTAAGRLAAGAAGPRAPAARRKSQPQPPPGVEEWRRTDIAPLNGSGSGSGGARAVPPARKVSLGGLRRGAGIGANGKGPIDVRPGDRQPLSRTNSREATDSR